MKKINKTNVRGGVSLDRISRCLKENKRKTMMTVVLIMAVFVVLLNTSFGYFKKRIEGTKLTFNVGTLNYELECVDLENCEITIPANSSEVFNVNLTSLNSIETKYELYYEVVGDDSVSLLNGGHIKEEDELTYFIDGNNTKNIPLVLNNSSNNSITVKLGVLPSLKSDNAELKNEQTSLNKESYQKYYVYDYSGDYQTFVAPKDGIYKLEAWGAQGAGDINYSGGFGAYTSGNIPLDKNQKLYVYVGESSASTTAPVFNNGSLTRYHQYGSSTGYMYAGGGSTDIRLVEGEWSNFNSIKSRIMVAAGGGGAQTYYKSFNGGAAGGLIGYAGESTGTSGNAASGAMQTLGGANGLGSNTSGALTNNTFGIVTYISEEGASGGNGYYAGGNGPHGNSTVGSGAGGSSFISGHNGCDAIEEISTEDNIIHTGQAEHYSGYVFTDTVMIDGQGYNWTTSKGTKEDMPNYDLTSTMAGNAGNGYARITYLGNSTYTIKYDPNGGSGTMEDDEVLEYEDFILSKNKFTKEGYGFAGWSLSPDNNEVIYKDETKISELVEGGNELTLYAAWLETTIITYNSNNLVYGLNDVSNLTNGNMTYSISDKVLTGTANADDGYAYTTGRVYLEAGKEYIFSCDVDKEWGSGEDTVESFLMLDGKLETYYRMGSSNNYTFTPTATGTYYLRLDVNKKGETATFSNITISYNVSTQEVLYGNQYGDMPTLTRTGYAFVGWFDNKYKNNPLNYYADTYSDLYKAYGYDETKLYNHYVNNGKSEGRRISQYLSTDKVTNTSNHMVYAGWKANTYTVKYVANGGSGTMANQIATYDSIHSISSNGFTRTGYTFVGWTTNSNGTDDGYNWTGWSGAWRYVNGQYGISNGTLTLYARWKSNIISHSSTGSHSASAVGSSAATWSFHIFDKVYTDIPTFSWTGGDDYTSHQIVAISQMGVVLKARNNTSSQQWPWYTWKVTGNAYDSVPDGVAQSGSINVGGVSNGSRSYTVTYSTPYTKAPKLYVVNHATHYSCSVSITSQSATGFTVKHTNSSSSTQYDTILWMAVDSNY